MKRNLKRIKGNFLVMLQAIFSRKVCVHHARVFVRGELSHKNSYGRGQAAIMELSLDVSDVNVQFQTGKFVFCARKIFSPSNLCAWKNYPTPPAHTK